MMVLKKGGLPNDAFLTLSGVSFKLIVKLSSRSISNLLYRSRMVAFRPSIFSRLGLTPRACTFTVTFPFLFKRTSGIQTDSVPVGLPCSHSRVVYPSRVFLCLAVFAIGWLNPRLCVDCGKTRPYDPLTTPAANAY